MSKRTISNTNKKTNDALACRLLGSLLRDFGAQNDPKKCRVQYFFGYFLGFKNTLCFCLVLDRLQDGPRGSQEALRPPQERPKRLQEAPKSAPGGSKRASRDPKRCQELPKTPTKLFRSTWSGSRFRKNKKNESIRPQGFSEALGPAVVFGKMEKFKAWLQKASKTLQVAEIYESQRPCLKSQNEKRRAGGGDPPWGSQSAASPAGAAARAGSKA